MCDLPFFSARWMNQKPHVRCDESIVLHVIDVVHFEWTPVFDVSPASKFNSILHIIECEGRVLRCYSCSEFTIEKFDFIHVLCRCEVEDGKELCEENLKVIFETLSSLKTYHECHNNLRLHF